jgi:hypothetical protein
MPLGITHAVSRLYSDITQRGTYFASMQRRVSIAHPFLRKFTNFVSQADLLLAQLTSEYRWLDSQACSYSTDAIKDILDVVDEQLNELEWLVRQVRGSIKWKKRGDAGKVGKRVWLKEHKAMRELLGELDVCFDVVRVIKANYMDVESRMRIGMDGHALGERMFGERLFGERVLEGSEDGWVDDGPLYGV